MLGTTSRTFKAQELRSALIDYGFIPLCKIRNAEHFVREGQRVIVAYEGDFPEQAEAELRYASAIERDGFIEISVH